MSHTKEQTESRNPEEQITKSVLNKNNEEANGILANIVFLCGLLFLLSWLLNLASIADTKSPASTLAFFFAVLICIFSGLLVLAYGTKTKYARYILILSLFIACAVIGIITVYGFWCALLIPIIASARYYDRKFSFWTGVAILGLMLPLMMLAVGIGINTQNVELSNLKFPEGTVLEIHGSLVETLSEAGLLDNPILYLGQLLNYIGYMLIFLPVILFSVLIAGDGRNNIITTAKLSAEVLRAEKEAAEAREKIMMSQLQPHFLYNALSSIMALEGNPPETVDALADFSKYLRGNLNSLRTENLIPFRQEMEHIGHYVSLERLRFGKKLRFLTDLKVLDFSVPMLSVQMSVENAIKHGITSRAEGGWVKVSTYEDKGICYVVIEDNGVGFDPKKYENSTAADHVGLQNSRSRIKKMTGGEMYIESKIGTGTRVTILIPKTDLL